MPINKSLSNILKIVITTGTLLYLGWRVYRFDRWEEALNQLDSAIRSPLIIFLIIPVLLLPINYGIETIKWRMAVRAAEPISFKKAILGILTGLSMSILTPNRIGDIVTRNFVLQPQNRISGTALTTINALAQSIVTILAGIPCALIFLVGKSKEDFSSLNTTLIFILGILTLTVSLILFLYLERVIQWLQKMRGFKWLKISVDELKTMNSILKLKILSLSALKYLVYLMQFALLLKFTGIDLPLTQSIPGISFVYLILHMVPVPSIGDIGVRGSVTLFILEPITGNLPALLFASMGIWMINILFPAILGLLLLPKIRF